MIVAHCIFRENKKVPVHQLRSGFKFVIADINVSSKVQMKNLFADYIEPHFLVCFLLAKCLATYLDLPQSILFLMSRTTM